MDKKTIGEERGKQKSEQNKFTNHRLLKAMKNVSDYNTVIISLLSTLPKSDLHS
jgi:hypothetical protein